MLPGLKPVLEGVLSMKKITQPKLFDELINKTALSFKIVLRDIPKWCTSLRKVVSESLLGWKTMG